MIMFDSDNKKFMSYFEKDVASRLSICENLGTGLWNVISTNRAVLRDSISPLPSPIFFYIPVDHTKNQALVLVLQRRHSDFMYIYCFTRCTGVRVFVHVCACVCVCVDMCVCVCVYMNVG